MKQKAETYKKKRIVMGDENLVTNSEIHIKDVVKDLYGDTPGGNTPSGSRYTGHADVEGLKAIGWTDEDIAYYQEHGVNWNEEDDEYHKVSDDNKALYGVLTADNISTYSSRIVYLPKIDTSGKNDLSSLFNNCYSLVAIPYLNTKAATKMSSMFANCYSLVSVPPMDTASVTTMSLMFSACRSIVSLPLMNMTAVTTTSSMCYNCYSLVSVPPMDVTSVTTVNQMFANCNSLVSAPLLNFSNVTLANSPFSNCYSLSNVKIKYSGKVDLYLNNSLFLSKESLLYIINEAGNGAFLIRLDAYAYERLANDADIVAALAAHPNISLAK